MKPLAAIATNASKENRFQREALSHQEAEAWRNVGQGWQQIFGNFCELGFSFEWHDFEVEEELDWSRSFHPGSVEICLNLAGRGSVVAIGKRADFAPLTAGFYHVGNPAPKATRRSGERHQFITVEFAPEFLQRHLKGAGAGLHPLIHKLLKGETGNSDLIPAQRLTSSQQEMIVRLRRPPVSAAAQALWYQVRALDLAIEFFFQPPEGVEFFCTRQHRAIRDRVDKAVTILRESLVEPPTLEELGKQVHSSPFYLSRMFKQEMGMTISQFLRQARMEKAAELLRTGRCNVTEAAMAVGYSSLGHFSTTFQETFGCCPGLYPLVTPTQKIIKAQAAAQKTVDELSKL